MWPAELVKVLVASLFLFDLASAGVAAGLDERAFSVLVPRGCPCYCEASCPKNIQAICCFTGGSQ
jgi:hypothetical protein